MLRLAKRDFLDVAAMLGNGRINGSLVVRP
jgi:hypothetical protein